MPVLKLGFKAKKISLNHTPTYNMNFPLCKAAGVVIEFDGDSIKFWGAYLVRHMTLSEHIMELSRRFTRKIFLNKSLCHVFTLIDC